MRDLKAVATEAIELPNNVCEVLVDIEDTMKTLAPKLERLVGVVRHSRQSKFSTAVHVLFLG